MNIDLNQALTLIIMFFGLLYTIYVYGKSRKIGFTIETALYFNNGLQKSYLTIINIERRAVTIKDIIFVSGKNSPFFIVGREILHNISHALPAPLVDGERPLTASFEPSELVEVMFRRNETFVNRFVFWWFCHFLRVAVVPHVGKVKSVAIDKHTRKMIWNKYKNISRTVEA